MSALRQLAHAVLSRLALLRLHANRHVRLGKGVRCEGLPQVFAYGTIMIGDDVVLNSCNFGYHANMPCPVKLMADRPDSRIEIGARSRLNGACLHAWDRIDIGEDVLMAAGVQILDANGHEIAPDGLRNMSKDTPRPVLIGNDVWLGLNVVVLPGTRLGDRCVVGANSVVKGEFGTDLVLAGNPAVAIRRLQTGGRIMP